MFVHLCFPSLQACTEFLLSVFHHWMCWGWLNSQDDGGVVVDVVNVLPLVTEVSLLNFVTVHRWHWYLCHQYRWLTCTCYHCDRLWDSEFSRDWKRTSSSASSLHRPFINKLTFSCSISDPPPIHIYFLQYFLYNLHRHRRNVPPYWRGPDDQQVCQPGSGEARNLTGEEICFYLLCRDTCFSWQVHDGGSNKWEPCSVVCTTTRVGLEETRSRVMWLQTTWWPAAHKWFL